MTVTVFGWRSFEVRLASRKKRRLNAGSFSAGKLGLRIFSATTRSSGVCTAL